MEDNTIYQESESSNLNLDSAGISHLKETRSWTYFISIVAFIFMGLLLVMGIAGGSILTRMNPMAAEVSGGVLVFTMLLMIAIYFFPIYFLFNFSRYSKMAIANNDSQSFAEAMRYLKLHYRYVGILLIIVLSIYLLVFIFALMAGSLGSMF